jgi:hypothetical protein
MDFLFPQSYVVPLFGVHPAFSRDLASRRAFLGTGFFVGVDTKWLVTCAHVVKDWPPDGSFYYMTNEPDDIHDGPRRTMTIREMDRPQLHPRLDLAVFTVPVTDFVDDTALNFSCHPFEDAFAVEFSKSHVVAGTLQLERRTRFHKGNVTGFHPEDGLTFLRTSFPAFEGASGGPIFVLRGAELCIAGMIVGEHDDERFLARREREQDGEKIWQSDYYTVPMGQAMASESLAKGLDELAVRYQTNHATFVIKAPV